MANPNTRKDFIKYCLRALGEPVIEVNIEEFQIQDRVDEALEYFQEFHTDATIRTYLKYQITATDVTNGYIPISPNITFITRLIPAGSVLSHQGNVLSDHFQVFSQMMNASTFSGSMAYYQQMRSHLQMLDMQLNGEPIVDYSREQNRLYLHGELGTDIKEGHYVLLEVYEIIDPDTHTSVYNNRMLKEYCTALFKRQWGQNMSKFDGMQLPGGVTINGQQMMQEANEEIPEIRERMRLEYEKPIDFYVG